MGIYQFNSRIVDANVYPFGYADAKKALWTPALLTTSLWLDAADADTITLDASGNVSQWSDKSGNSRHATQSTSGIRPDYDGDNKRVVFDKTNTEYLVLASQPFSGTTARTVFAVVTATSYGSVGGGYFSVTGTVAASSGEVWELSIESSGFFIRIFGNDYFTPAVTTNNQSIIAAQWESGSSSNSAVWHDGNSLTRAGGSSASINTATGTTQIGATTFQPDDYFDGYIYDMVVVTGTLSTANRQLIEGWLAWKNGLQGKLPNTHPYIKKPPTTNDI
jgi:hypothetical protein